ncbi:uncharacterized protein TNIN_43421 [Trichonephila inaurata madagascariensis]|uniref:Uncharacterized protein n=1 Tax=Trichonephila inaurata madagascariensis TaxID=2747483 RepID=A0A8X6YG37_9ARAC|nr:uncharacterized protein TNIN_43421 [Trichonephila inaurata madagascariensis]
MDVPKMWDLEVLGITDPIEKKNESLLEEETLAHFKETIRICEDQRYEVALPWLAGHPALYDKYDAAESRLRTATKRLINENYFEAFDNVFKQWKSEGIIEAVPIYQLSKEVHYLPHRPVIKPSSNTTKVLPVFDASFKKPGFASLNECLSVVPSLIHKILPLLIRFCFGAIDASAYAYATCAFLRCEFKGQVTVKLIVAKARLAPLKKSTIPRLELLGAALGARLAETVHSILLTASKTHFWDLTNIDDWRHVPGEVNPADLATRCCDWSDLLKSKWWEGSSWLYSNEESWPCSEVSETPDEAFLERRKTVVTNLATGNEVRLGDRFMYFSSYKKILRMTAYVLRFCNNIKRNSPKLVNSLSCEEIKKAEETLIKIMQS